MFSFANILSPLAILVSLTTATGIFVHDTNIDKAASKILSLPSTLESIDSGMAAARLGNDPHNHVEQVSFSQVVRDLGSAGPRIQPRQEDKKYVAQKNSIHGDFLFDNYNLPRD